MNHWLGGRLRVADLVSRLHLAYGALGGLRRTCMHHRQRLADGHWLTQFYKLRQADGKVDGVGRTAATATHAASVAA